MDPNSFASVLSHVWLPVLAAAAAVWVASAVVWMAMPHHRRDWRKLPDEPGFAATLRALNIPPGLYSFPHFASHGECNSPEARARWLEGPTGTLSLWKTDVSMGKNMAATFLVYLVVSAMIGYLGVVTVAPGADFLRAFQVFGTAGVLAYSFAFIPNGIWFQHGRATVMCVFDGIAYGLITGAVMAWLWPGAA